MNKGRLAGDARGRRYFSTTIYRGRRLAKKKGTARYYPAIRFEGDSFEAN